MAVYKVPQDVEADDKLIGPFSFRQFVYLIIVALAIALAWGLSQLFVPLAIIPLPIILLFGALALPLRKDQPMEIYLAAIISFFLKPHRRLWEPDGIDSLIEITVPRTVEVKLTKDISQNEALRRFGYLAEIVDTQGWAVRGPGVQAPNSAMNSDAYFEAQQAQDIMDSDTTTARSFNFKLDQSDARRHQEAVNIMRGQSVNQTPESPTVTPLTTPVAPVINQTPSVAEHLEYNPYPNSIQQAVINPINATKPQQTTTINPAKQAPTTTSEKPLSAGIINLASNNSLSIETIAREANRIHEKQELNEEVVISLR